MSEGQTKQQRRQKSEELSEAIISIDRITNQLVGLRDQIQGEGQNSEKAATEELYKPLAELLESGADDIRDRVNRADKLISEIRELLF